jgi:hypothetical protein
MGIRFSWIGQKWGIASLIAVRVPANDTDLLSADGLSDILVIRVLPGSLSEGARTVR